MLIIGLVVMLTVNVTVGLAGDCSISIPCGAWCYVYGCDDYYCISGSTWVKCYCDGYVFKYYC